MPAKTRLFVIRPKVPGPLVIVDNNLPARVEVAPGIERGKVTEAEKRKYMPPAKSLRVRNERQAAMDRARRYAEYAPTKRVGAYTPPRGWNGPRKEAPAPVAYAPPMVEQAPPFRRALTRFTQAIGRGLRLGQKG